MEVSAISQEKDAASDPRNKPKEQTYYLHHDVASIKVTVGLRALHDSNKLEESCSHGKSCTDHYQT